MLGENERQAATPAEQHGATLLTDGAYQEYVDVIVRSRYCGSSQSASVHSRWVIASAPCLPPFQPREKSVHPLLTRGSARDELK